MALTSSLSFPCPPCAEGHSLSPQPLDLTVPNISWITSLTWLLCKKTSLPLSPRAPPMDHTLTRHCLLGTLPFDLMWICPANEHAYFEGSICGLCSFPHTFIKPEDLRHPFLFLLAKGSWICLHLQFSYLLGKEQSGNKSLTPSFLVSTGIPQLQILRHTKAMPYLTN